MCTFCHNVLPPYINFISSIGRSHLYFVLFIYYHQRANGEGNIRKRKDGRWEGRYTVGRDSETGKAIIKNVLGKTQAEVKEKLKKAIEENVGIDYGRAKTYTVGSWLEVWMENYARVKLRPSTFKTSQGFLKNHIKPQIGGIPLADLTSLDLQRFYKHLLDGGRVDRIEAKKKPKGLAPKTVRNIHQMIDPMSRKSTN